jgi:outer membrane protein
MKRNVTLILSLIFTLTFAQLQAQTDTVPGTRVWTLRECVDYALESSLSVKRSELDVEVSRIDYNLAKWSMIPSLNGSASYGLNWGRSINPVTNLFTTQEIRSNQLAAQSSVTLFNGLRIQNEIKQNRYNLDASQADLENIRNDVIINVVTLYVNVIFNKELLDNARLQLRSSEAQLQRTRVQVELGALPMSDQLNLEAEVASNELNVVNQENALALSLLQLKQAMQLPATAELDVEVPELTVEDLMLDVTREEVFQTALRVMPEIRAADLRVEGWEHGIKAARGNLYPRLSLFGSLTTNYSSASDGPHFVPSGDDMIPVVQEIGYVEGTGQRVLTNTFETPGTIEETYGRRQQFEDNLFRSLNFSLQIPVFNGMQARSAYQRSIIARNQAELNRADVRNILRQEVETAYNDAVAAQKTYQSAQQQVAAREEAFRSIQARYNSGASNYFEYQLAENQLFQARSDLSRAKYNFIFRKKILDFYQNKPVDF